MDINELELKIETFKQMSEVVLDCAKEIVEMNKNYHDIINQKIETSRKKDEEMLGELIRNTLSDKIYDFWGWIELRLDRIENLSTLAAKNVLNIDDVAILTGMSKGYVYQLTHDKKIPFYKPTGKQIYFDRSEVEAWMKRNRVNSVDEAQSKAVSYVVRKGG